MATERSMREELGEVELFLEFCTGSPFTCCSGVFQRVPCADGVSSLGRTSHSNLVNGTNPELVQASFLESKYRVAARFLNVRIAAHPLAPTHVTSGKESTKERRGYKEKKRNRSGQETKEDIHVGSTSCAVCRVQPLQSIPACKQRIWVGKYPAETRNCAQATSQNIKLFFFKAKQSLTVDTNE